jgi:hypothetical protein
MIDIEIDLGRHTMNIPRGTESLFEKMIESLGIVDGDFKIHLGKVIPGASKKGLKLLRVLHQYCAIVVGAQPSGKDARHACTVYFPDVYKSQLDRFAEVLMKNNGKEKLSEEEIETIIKDKDTTENTLSEAEIAQRQYKIQLEREALDAIFTPDLLASIVTHIYEKNEFDKATEETVWVGKDKLFKQIHELGLKKHCPANQIIGRLFKGKYLQGDPARPGEYSSISDSGLAFIGKQRKKIDTISCEEKNTVTKIAEENILQLRLQKLFESAKEFNRISLQSHVISDELKALMDRQIFLSQQKSLIEKELLEVEMEIREKEMEAADLAEKLTPGLLEAHRRIMEELPV